MRYLVTGASGYLGSRVVARLIARGHHVLGLARSENAAAIITGLGAEPVIGDLADPEVWLPVARTADCVVHTAFDHGGDFMEAVEEERRTVGALVEAFGGTGRLIVGTTATGVLGDTGPDGPVDETFPGQTSFPARVRMAVEEDLQAAAARDVRAVVIRPAILVHGHGASQFVPHLVAAAHRSGVAAYNGEGSNRITTVHVDDLADLYALAVERAPAGSIYNAAGGEISTRALAEALAAGKAGLRTASVTPDAAAGIWGAFPAMLLGIENRAAGTRACRELGWSPYAATPSLADELRFGTYVARSNPAA